MEFCQSGNVETLNDLNWCDIVIKYSLFIKIVLTLKKGIISAWLLAEIEFSSGNIWTFEY